MCISFHYFEEQATAIILDADTGPANTPDTHTFTCYSATMKLLTISRFIYFINKEDVDKYEHLVKLCCV